MESFELKKMLIVSSRGVIATNLQVNGNFAVNKTKFVEAISILSFVNRCNGFQFVIVANYSHYCHCNLEKS